MDDETPWSHRTDDMIKAFNRASTRAVLKTHCAGGYISQLCDEVWQDVYLSRDYHLDADRARSGVDEGWADEYEKRIAWHRTQKTRMWVSAYFRYLWGIPPVPVFPIGNCATEHITLYQASDGVVYGGFDDLLWYIGVDLDEAIACIEGGGPFEEIP